MLSKWKYRTKLRSICHFGRFIRSSSVKLRMSASYFELVLGAALREWIGPVTLLEIQLFKGLEIQWHTQARMKILFRWNCFFRNFWMLRLRSSISVTVNLWISSQGATIVNYYNWQWSFQEENKRVGLNFKLLELCIKIVGRQKLFTA